MRVAAGVERGDEAEERVVGRGRVDPAVRTEPGGLLVQMGVIEGITGDLRVTGAMLLPSILFAKGPPFDFCMISSQVLCGSLR